MCYHNESNVRDIYWEVWIFFSGKEQLCKWDKYLAKNNFTNRIASNCKIWHQGATRKKNTRLLWGLTSCERQRPSQAPSFKISSFISKGYMHVRKSQRSYQYINIVVTKFFYGTTTWSTDVVLAQLLDTRNSIFSSVIAWKTQHR